MFCPGGFCPEGFWQGGFLYRGFLSGGLCPEGFCLGGFCPRTHMVLAFKFEDVPAVPSTKRVIFEMKDRFDSQTFVQNPLT